MDAEDLQLFTDSLRQTAQRPNFDGALEELGWRDALLDEPSGAAAALFAVQGETGVSSSALDDVIVAALGLEPSAELAVVLSPISAHAAPGSILDGQLVVAGVGTQRLRSAEEVVVVAPNGADHVVAQVRRTSLDLRFVDGMDPAGGWVEVTGSLEVPGDLTPVSWDAAVVAGRLAIAQELASASRTMLRLARDHAAERIQFGRPIGSFQAVRHRLADCLIAVESADAAVSVGWAEPSMFTATMAKAIAGRSSRTVARHAQQVLAGMGFTSEHPFHLYLKRVLVLDQLLGSGAALSAEIGNEILRTRTLPTMLVL